jgi:hypothetical protein
MMASDPRSCLAAAAAAFVELVERVPSEAWARPALGTWDVRGLVGHTSRALSTIETYLTQPGDGAHLDGPVAYFQAALRPQGDPKERRKLAAAVRDRGRAAGEALGADPARKVRELATRIVAIVDRTPDDAPVATPFGQLGLADYLPTRTFELTVHSLDLARAVPLAVPTSLQPAISASCELAGHLAGALPTAADLLLLITGRRGLPRNLSLV